MSTENLNLNGTYINKVKYFLGVRLSLKLSEGIEKRCDKRVELFSVVELYSVFYTDN